MMVGARDGNQLPLPSLGDGVPLFNPNSLELLSKDFALNLSYYRNYHDDDRLAKIFLGCALEVVDCTFYTYTKTRDEAKSRIANSFTDCWSDDVYGTHLLENILDPALMEEVIEQNNLLLEVLREKFEGIVKGALPSCWEESSRSIAEGMEKCRSWSGRCEEEHGADGLFRTRCDRYYSSWSNTMLALENCESLRHDPKRLAAEIGERCRILSLLAIPEGLENFLAGACWQDTEGDRDGRSVRGIIVRILTMLVDECLADLSRMMHLPQNRFFYLARLPC